MSPFVNCNLKLDMSELTKDLVNFTWTRHGHNMPSCVLPDRYSKELNKIFRLPARSYIMIHNLLPTHTMSPNEIPYLTKWHIDTHRKSAIMIPVSIDNNNHYTEFLINGTTSKALYSRGVPLLFDVTVIHKVSNTDLTLPRNIISIGLPDMSYTELLSLYENNLLINYKELADNLFSPCIIDN